jgi:glycogen operon protein
LRGQRTSFWFVWHDRFRDDVRRFWRGDVGVALLATRLVFADLLGLPCRSVNFLVAYDGLRWLTPLLTPSATIWRMARSWLDWEGRNLDLKAHVASAASTPANSERQSSLPMLHEHLGVSGSIMLALGDEIGRTQGGNNNAYAQDNRLVWLDWEGRNLDLKAHVASAASTPADSEQAVLIADASRAPRCLRVHRAIRR